MASQKSFLGPSLEKLGSGHGTTFWVVETAYEEIARRLVWKVVTREVLGEELVGSQIMKGFAVHKSSSCL